MHMSQCILRFPGFMPWIVVQKPDTRIAGSSSFRGNWMQWKTISVRFCKLAIIRTLVWKRLRWTFNIYSLRMVMLHNCYYYVSSTASKGNASHFILMMRQKLENLQMIITLMATMQVRMMILLCFPTTEVQITEMVATPSKMFPVLEIMMKEKTRLIIPFLCGTNQYSQTFLATSEQSKLSPGYQISY